ncbi:hypothetical protein [Umezawaea tangerina]|uniref:Uncharacterized protein n=1 Tax=Umezawaea tangerina TaxID=84725 RepID=A0A2T0SX16_9PSEU|nr:hypothetical protein [Umezawaea tangerina]PRY37957.1 hypothetical protein CLV43_109177 [Umezawaea tangerina]
MAWTGFRTTSDRQDFTTLIDRPGSGDLHPLGSALLGLGDTHFTGLDYGTDTNGTDTNGTDTNGTDTNGTDTNGTDTNGTDANSTSLTVAEAETATGFVDPDSPDTPDGLAEVEARLPPL